MTKEVNYAAIISTRKILPVRKASTASCAVLAGWLYWHMKTGELSSSSFTTFGQLQYLPFSDWGVRTLCSGRRYNSYCSYGRGWQFQTGGAGDVFRNAGVSS